jgi:hypothetical protein
MIKTLKWGEKLFIKNYTELSLFETLIVLAHSNAFSALLHGIF